MKTDEARAREMAREDIHHRLSTSTGLARLHKRDTMTVRTEDIFALLEWRWELAADRDAARRDAYREAAAVAQEVFDLPRPPCARRGGCLVQSSTVHMCAPCAYAHDVGMAMHCILKADALHHRATTAQGAEGAEGAVVLASREEGE